MLTALTEDLSRLAKDSKRPDGSEYRSLLFQDETSLAQKYDIPRIEVQETALRLHIVPERYARNQTSISNKEQIGILNSHVAIIGLGGLGGGVTEILSRIGIGKLTLVDGDCFDESNLNRQLLSSVDQLGKMKARAAAERVTAINPAIETHSIEEYLTANNSDNILRGTDIVIDCLDTINDRFILEESCRRLQLPLVSAAIGGNSGQVTVILPGEHGLKRIYGEPSKTKKRGIEATLGTLPFTAMAVAALESSIAVTLAAGKPSNLKNKLLLADFSYYTMDVVEFE